MTDQEHFDNGAGKATNGVTPVEGAIPRQSEDETREAIAKAVK